MNSPVESPKPHLAARRKLVRGVFAAPAIMTVCSGNAFANTSNLRCLARNMTDMTNAGPKVGGLDTWARVQLHKATDGSYYVSGTQVQSVFTHSNSHYPGVGNWLAIDMANGNVPTGTAWSVPNAAMPPGADLNYTTPQYVIVRFDSTGSVTGVGNAGTGYNVGESCWNSFKNVV